MIFWRVTLAKVSHWMEDKLSVKIKSKEIEMS